jgi:hypothetical protein
MIRDSVGPRDSVRIRPKGRVMSSLEFAYFFAKMKKKNANKREPKPEKVETQNGEMISISPLRCRNL